ncbi:MAG: LLM class flavin-dependent oxidoreductase [Chloroflexi bacterium]|nr:LLM class flavin-dependent oxidoreductase [Chloroflexota bacterium]
MAVRFGIVGLASSPFSDFLTLAKMADEGSFALVALGDSQSLYREVYVSLALVALKTRNVLIGPMVTNPLTRHPAITASAIATVDEIAGGRAVLGIGTGDSAVYNLGLRGARLDHMREYIVALKELFTRHETQYQGRTIRVTWPQRRVPIYMSAEGPKSLRLAGQLCDGVMIGLGLTPEVIRDAISCVHQGAREAGRDPKEIDMWWLVKTNVSNDPQQALEESRMALAASANHAFRFTLEGKHVPPELVDKVEEIKRRYVSAEHEKLGAERTNARLVDDLGLKEYLAERFALIGTPDQCVAKIRRMAEAGATNLALTVLVADKIKLVKTLRDRVLSHFR